ncbi:MAG: DUF2961 domain-containing protein [Tannerellaceae bacterium]|jgi:hypothetical protein|nr:DUF2961 domain-containing protein [Tannerellaceae bacterium]
MIPVKYIFFHLPVAVVFYCCLFSCWGGKVKDVTLGGLLDEMISVEEGARYPVIPYRALSVSGEMQEVLFDQQGPGVVTRIFLVTEDKEAVIRFYLDKASEPEITLSAGNLSLPDLLEEDGGLLYRQPGAEAEGSALYLPIPYDKHCRITLGNTAGNPLQGYYRIDYRQYPEDTPMETFSLKMSMRLKKKIADVNDWLLHPQPARPTHEAIRGEVFLEAGAPVVVKLPKGEHAVYELQLQVMPQEEDYAQTMRNLVLQGIFDGKQTMRVPVADFSGGGMRAEAVKSPYIEADGKGFVCSRWLMPYMEKASLAFINEGRKSLRLRYAIHVYPLPWDERMLYFHASWKEETEILIRSSEDQVWNFASIRGGRGVYKGDVFSLFNRTPGWKGQGGDRLRSDKDSTASQAGSNLWHYYTRADKDYAYGYHTFFRTRLVDGIPFADRFSFDVEWRGRRSGMLDCATTVFWYGDRKARPEETSRPEVTTRRLPLPMVSESDKEPGN